MSDKKEIYREGLAYLIWGGVAFVLSMVLFWVFTTSKLPFGWNEVVANTVDWVICVLFTFVTNKFFVFKSKAGSLRGFGREFVSFVLARLFTLLLEDVIIWVLCGPVGWDEGLLEIAAKLIGQFVVIVSNYILSKLIVFRKPKANAEEIDKISAEDYDSDNDITEVE
ncbi:MAG: GtrA family protein [Lachnospiraceae bacterium]|jgi:putative flippase GtrA|nr:GtrA family protein [Lachnospiraceae bacterium]